MKNIILVAGARPNFMKIAPLIEDLKKERGVTLTLVHTGQHYDAKMSRVFFKELGIPKPQINLGIGSGTQAVQTAKIIMAFDVILEQKKPDLVIVVGDVNSTVACALAAVKRGIKIAHVEAGLRSFDWTMPEEINRVLTDRLSDFLFCTEPSALKNLEKEGIDKKRVYFVGNVMIDTLLRQKKAAEKSSVLKQFNLEGANYAVATLHRPANVDNQKNLKKLISLLNKIGNMMQVLFPVHPRTEDNLKKWGITGRNIKFIEPLGYLDFLKAVSHATVVLTDSGGIQEETTILGVPCITLRKNTERPITVTDGTNHLAGMDEEKILHLARSTVSRPRKNGARAPKYWDGNAAKRIVKILMKKL